MAHEESPQQLGFLSAEQVEDLFDREHVFEQELESETIARVNWMEARHRASFLAFALELGIEPKIAASLSTGHQFLSRQFSDFVSIGLDADHEFSPISHPLEGVFNDLCTDITENSDGVSLQEDIITAHELMNRVHNGSDEELLHRLEHFRSLYE